ncbi:MAG: class I SAM-dependent methyltransferase, partial [Candidatus Heimdallarchaeota archaeon]|nr:class I SAM-dependent methyltransferase [Candidatus Heimdallarchaeota archaeon]
YPINTRRFDLDDDTPRCELHFQFTCDTCFKPTHFNGISYCVSCSKYTCINCGEEKIRKINFLIYDYYYTISCSTCSTIIPALDYAEFNLSHPYQIGAEKPKGDLLLWVPMQEKYESSPGLTSGNIRISKLAKIQAFRKIDTSDSINSKTIWDENAEHWAGTMPEGGDVHHKQLIIPNLLDLLSPKEDEKILDVGCGEGTVSRILARKGCELTGIDISQNMLNYGILKEKEEKLGISYYNYDATEIGSKLKGNRFDKIFSNMAIMDMDLYKKIFSNIFLLLKPGGVFVFSITHPCFGWPTTNTVKLPKDSQRNEDKILIFREYSSGVTVIDFDPKLRLLYFTRSISEYLNSLMKIGYIFDEMREPKVNKELAYKYPRDFYNDLTDYPAFLLIKVRKM